MNPVLHCREAVFTCYKYRIISDVSGYGIYSQEYAEVSRSSKKQQLSAGQSLGGQAHGLWTRTF